MRRAVHVSKLQAAQSDVFGRLGDRYVRQNEPKLKKDKSVATIQDFLKVCWLGMLLID